MTMNKLTLNNRCINCVTALSNTFIDSYMPLANGEFVKIYIYLLRCISDGQAAVSISAMADFFNQTEADVVRALRYWDKVGAVCLDLDASGTEIYGITFCDLSGSKPVSTPVPEIPASDTAVSAGGAHSYTTDYLVTPSAPSTAKSVPLSITPVTVETRTASRAGTAYTPQQMKAFCEQDDFSMLLYAVGAYMGGTLSPSEASTIAYFYDALHFPPDLIEYLIEYCVSKGHKNMRYIEKVGLAWAEAGISTVREAKLQTSTHSETAYSVLNAFGITNRDAGQRERDYIQKWTDVYSFDCDIIIEACNRTLRATHQPSFEYADSILTKWQAAKVQNLEDIKKADAEYELTRTVRKSAGPSGKTANRFNNFHQRTADIDESSLISNNG